MDTKVLKELFISKEQLEKNLEFIQTKGVAPSPWARRLLTLSLHYSEALLDDMHWRVQIFESDMGGFDTKEEMQEYISHLENFVEELREILR